ncbi:MAG TPA: dTDP-4-dehydrorhamnose 3,5-epimerase [Burkholderiales bacterium]|jgi:dTDP-4-dehydrorhamnose 3,5-epimerase|nr:dTDP-4-dehydrorhamnose 3,5-epimerase [Burkholderiales bacterium]
MRRIDLPLAGPCLLEPDVFEDARGLFFETWNERTLAALGISAHFVQENHSRSARGVLRGLHYQMPQGQGKLLRLLAGEIFDVVVDLRRGSANFGRWHGSRLSAQSRQMLWVPAGFAHGFLALSEVAEVLYAITDFYAPGAEHTLAWDDPALGIAWPLAAAGVAAPVLSAKDARGLPLAAAPVFE